jgi:glutathione peroxidase
MSILKQLAQKLYPLRMRVAAITKIGLKMKYNEDNKAPEVSFYTLTAESNRGEQVSMKNFSGKKILIVNLASECGYTPQYKELEELYRQHKDALVILGFPSNQFGQQEPGSDEDIANFCQLNFGVTFPLFRKSEVKGVMKSEIYKWLSDSSLNGWNDQEPDWNFCKYVVDENGYLTHFFNASTSPMSEEVLEAISEKKNDVLQSLD